MPSRSYRRSEEGVKAELVTAVIKPSTRRRPVALENLRVQGMTVSEASGYGRQKGHTSYRGAEYTVDPRTQAAPGGVVDDSDADDVVDVIASRRRQENR